MSKQRVRYLNVSWEKKDDRKNKTYRGELRIMVHFEDGYEVDRGSYSPFFSALKVLAENHSFSNIYWSCQRGETSFTFSWITDVTKPSEIPDEATMLKRLGGKERLRTLLEEWAEVAERHRDAYALTIDTNRHANHLVRHYTEAACGLAKGVVRYEQRLAALKAEYVVEVEVQVSKNIKQWTEDCEKDDDVLNEAIPHAMKALPEYADESAKTTGLFRSGNIDPVKVSLAEPEEWINEQEEKDGADAERTTA